MKLFLSGLSWLRIVLVIALGFLLFVSFVFTVNIPERIERGASAQAAIAQLDAVRRPMLQIKALENSVIISHDAGTAITDLATLDSVAEHIIKRYSEIVQYDAGLLLLVEQFAKSYENWVAKEQLIFQHLLSEDAEQNIAHLSEADRLLLDALNILAKGEDPIHADIDNGRQAERLLQISGAALVLYLFIVILVFQRVSSKQLAAREQDLYTTLHSIGDAVISTDIKGSVTRMNTVAQKLTGWSIDEAKGQPLTKVFKIEHAITGETVINPVDIVLKKGQVVGLANHTVLVSRNGNRYQIDDSAAPIKNQTGEVQGVVLVFHDVTEDYTVQQTIKEQASRLSSIVEGSMDAIIAADESGVIVEWNSLAETMFGWTRDEILGTCLHETIIPVRYRDDHLKGIKRFRQTGESTIIDQRFEITALHKDGREFPIELTVSKLDVKEGYLFSAFLRDLTDRKKVEQELQLAAITFESHSGIVITDNEKRILRVNPAMETMTGYSAEEMIGEYPSMLKSDRQDDDFYKKMWQQINSRGNWQGELWNKRKDGSLYAELLTITAVNDKAGKIINYVGTSNDITERKNAEEKIERLAYYDELTGLTNRRLLLDRLGHEMSVAGRYHTYGSLLYLDLDRFKNLNDALGHPVGDELLRQVAKRLKQLFRSEDTVSRLGGDEFVVMLPARNTELTKATIEAGSVADKIKEHLSEVFDLEGYRYYLNTSIGIVVFPETEESPDDILKHADVALYLAKAEGRNTARFYKPAMQKTADTRLQLEKDIRHALENDELELHYQPQVASDGHIIGAEALLRWHHPERGIILPNKFIPLAEETGLILDIGNWVLKKAIEHVQQWHKIGICPSFRSLAINVSPRQFHQADFVEHILDLINCSGVSPGCIELEITEGLLMDGIGDVVERLTQLREHDIKIAIDDFGTGYSSLSYLKTLPLDKLKIDQSFVHDITTDSNDAAIVDTIIAMSKHLGLNVIAEGVETNEQLNFLKSKGCEFYQGYYFSKPVTVKQMMQILKNNAI